MLVVKDFIRLAHRGIGVSATFLGPRRSTDSYQFVERHLWVVVTHPAVPGDTPAHHVLGSGLQRAVWRVLALRATRSLSETPALSWINSNAENPKSDGRPHGHS